MTFFIYHMLQLYLCEAILSQSRSLGTPRVSIHLLKRKYENAYIPGTRNSLRKGVDSWTNENHGSSCLELGLRGDGGKNEGDGVTGEWSQFRALALSCRFWVLSCKLSGATGVLGIAFLKLWSQGFHLKTVGVSCTQNWKSKRLWSRDVKGWTQHHTKLLILLSREKFIPHSATYIRIIILKKDYFFPQRHLKQCKTLSFLYFMQIYFPVFFPLNLFASVFLKDTLQKKKKVLNKNKNWDKHLVICINYGVLLMFSMNNTQNGLLSKGFSVTFLSILSPSHMLTVKRQGWKKWIRLECDLEAAAKWHRLSPVPVAHWLWESGLQ